MLNFISRLFGTANDRMIRRCQKIISEINKKEEEYQNFTNEELQGCTLIFKERLLKNETIDDLLVDAFAVVREASKRVFSKRHFDVQLIGGLTLHNGMIAEMKTGEGKTLTATLPVYLNALSGKGIHIITVNDYLAKRDADEMGQLYGFLGLTTGCIVHGLTDSERREQYGRDITYGTNHEYGFDYLRDNMKFRLNELVMRPFNYAIVDEVDSILIDEARTPLIISGPAEDSSTLYQLVDRVIASLQEGDFEKDIKQKNVTLTDQGVEKIEESLKKIDILQGNGLYDLHNITLVHHVNAALKAHNIFEKDVDYIVKEGKVLIIDEFTGRMMEGRRYSDGLHQAIEAKEHVDIENENQTLASITYQNFFRMYPKLSGMTGTALTEEAEFQEIYNLRVVSIPTNVPVTRIDFEDEVYLTANEKFNAVLGIIKECQAIGQPVLVGTASIERSEYLSELLKENNIPHKVLNARHHDKEAFIIAEAGSSDAITIATNMAGRGTDIKLGGSVEMRAKNDLRYIDNEEEKELYLEHLKTEVEEDNRAVIASGGLYVIGTERHESRRIDNQLRGRSGRQGDPGASRFFVSLQDELMKRFGSDRLDVMLRRLGAKEGEVISHPWITKALERAQRKVEAHNFEIRKHLLKYDDVMNDQRKIVYSHRLELLKAESIADMIFSICEEVVEQTVYQHMPTNSLPDQWDSQGLHAAAKHLFNLDLPIQEWCNTEGTTQTEVIQKLETNLEKHLQEKEIKLGAQAMRAAEKNILLRVLDQHWKDHLLTLDHLRQGINLTSYAQGNPLNEYKREAFNLFQNMLYTIKADTLSTVTHFEMDAAQNSQKHFSFDDELGNILNPELNFNEFDEETPDWENDPLFKDQQMFDEIYEENKQKELPLSSLIKKQPDFYTAFEDTLPHVSLYELEQGQEEGKEEERQRSNNDEMKNEEEKVDKKPSRRQFSINYIEDKK